MMLKYAHPNFPVQYKVGKFVKPNIENTSLMVFETYEQAIGFKNRYGDRGGKIFEVETKNIKRFGISYYIYANNFEAKIQEMINLKKQKKKYIHLTGQPPKGTMFASEVKLIKEIA